jgi:hypothetical protein
MKRLTWIMAGLLLAAAAAAQPPPPPPDSGLRPPAQRGPHPGDRPRPHHPPRFVDLNGDGINDLAPDRDGDGLPDALDPMFRGAQVRWRLHWLRSMPQEARQDSAAFAKWWNEQGAPVPADRAWRRWKGAWFFSAPDSVRGNRDAFRNWWMETRRPAGWEMGWRAWNRWLERGGPGGMGPFDRRGMFDPRDRHDWMRDRRDRDDRRRRP